MRWYVGERAEKAPEPEPKAGDTKVIKKIAWWPMKVGQYIVLWERYEELWIAEQRAGWTCPFTYHYVKIPTVVWVLKEKNII